MSAKNKTKKKGTINIIKRYSKPYGDYKVSYSSELEYSDMPIDLAEAILGDVLEPFMEFIKNIGIFEIISYSEESEERNYTYINVWDEKNKNDLIKTVILDEIGNKHYEDNSYLLKYNGNEYIMRIYDDVDVLGFCNLFENEQYIMCHITKLGFTKRSKYDVIFSFDIQTMRFIELFEIEKHSFYMSKWYKKQASNETVDKLVEKFAGMKLMEL